MYQYAIKIEKKPLHIHEATLHVYRDEEASNCHIAGYSTNKET